MTPLSFLTGRATSFWSRQMIALFALAVITCTSVGADKEEAVHIAPSYAQPRHVGAAKVDITPRHPILLSGYAARQHQLQLNVRHRLWARAFAVSDSDSEPAILITVDNCGVPAIIRDKVVAALKEKHHISPERVTISASHTHGGPMLSGMLENLLIREMTDAEREAVDGYTNELTQHLIEVASKAFMARQPAHLWHGKGTVDFAINRRSGMVVDHDLPILVAADLQGKPFAVISNYACHCVAASNGIQMTGDWAGCAVAEVERMNPDLIGLTTIGCAGDQNPSDKGGIEAAERQGKQLAVEVDRILATKLKLVEGKLRIRFRQIELPFDEIPDEATWEAKAEQKGIEGFHALRQLKQLRQQGSLPQTLKYPVQTWRFGSDLAMVFLGDEVVVDYALLIKSKYDPERLWVSAYSNDVACYVPSERILREGGYEGGGAMVWYNQPTKFAPGLEKLILEEVDRQLGEPETWKPHPKTGGSPPLSPEDAISKMHFSDRFRVELVAAEPLVVDPVAIDFGQDGKLWVVEMNDYPMGVDGQPNGGGKVKFLEDTDQNGTYDRSTLFLDELPYPTGVMAWRNGVLICAAPDVIYAEDTDGDGRADIQRVILKGFATHNYQARVNGLSLGLDNWIYGAGGLFGGMLQSETRSDVDTQNRDFRFRPDTGEVEAVAGRTQQGRARDDWGNWFGCVNGSLLMHYPVGERYYERNPQLKPPGSIVSLAAGETLLPLGETIRFKLSGAVGTPTSVCGLGIYRDSVFGEDFQNNTFSCEPVNQLVHRRVLDYSKGQITSHRAMEEQDREFLASTDNWFRPVQAQTGPDGMLWIVDMYRYVIEHPKFLSDEIKADLDLRAGDTRGRIYRVIPKDATPRPIPNLREMSSEELVDLLDSTNGTLRDKAHLELLWRKDPSIVKRLKERLTSFELPQGRLHALSVLEGMGSVDRKDLTNAFKDSHAAVRRLAICFAENHIQTFPDLEVNILETISDPAPSVRMQAAFSLGSCRSREAANHLADLLTGDAPEPALHLALQSSVNAENIAAILDRLLEKPQEKLSQHDKLFILAAEIGTPAVASQAFASYLADVGGPLGGQRLTTIGRLIEVLASRKIALDKYCDLSDLQEQLSAIVTNAGADPVDRTVAIAAVTHLEKPPVSVHLLTPLLVPQEPQVVQQQALKSLASISSPEVPAAILDRLPSFPPAMQALAVNELTTRPQMSKFLLDQLEDGMVPFSTIDLTQRQTLTTHPDNKIRQRAIDLFSASSNSKISAKLDIFRQADLTGGDVEQGKSVFQQHCAACHRYKGIGSAVGPDLKSLTDRSKEFMLTAILAPNAAVDGRYASYSVLLEDGRVLSGILASESNQSITLKEKSGVERRILRSDIELLKATGKSLMPEGLEQVLSIETTKHLLAFLEATRLGPASSREIDPQFNSVVKLANSHQVILDGTDEYQEIPAIFHTTLAAGGRNDADEITAILRFVVPLSSEPLQDWETVALTGVVKGISESDVWPKKRLASVLSEDQKLQRRWNRTLELAFEKAEDTNVRSGTRYDAIRLLALSQWEAAKPVLSKYIQPNSQIDLIHGSIDGLADSPHPEAAVILCMAYNELPERLKGFAQRGLLRVDGNKQYLLTAIDEGLISPKAVPDAIRDGLVAHPNRAICTAAKRVFSQSE